MKTQSLVPMLSVADVERSIAFYSHLGFEVANSLRVKAKRSRRGHGFNQVMRR